MKKLDVTKPMMIEDEKVTDKTVSVEYLRSIGQYEYNLCHVFIVTSESGNQSIAVTDKFGVGKVRWCDIKIINVPEKTAFSWDKPIRCKDSSYEVIKTHDNSALLEYRDGTRMWRDYYEDGKFYSETDDELDLENYEPEETCRIEALDYIGSKTWRVHYSKGPYQAKQAHFQTEEDAELFKQAKEQQL